MAGNSTNRQDPPTPDVPSPDEPKETGVSAAQIKAADDRIAALENEIAQMKAQMQAKVEPKKEPEKPKGPRVNKTYVSNIPRYQILRGPKTEKGAPPPSIEFYNGQFSTDDPEIQSILDNHKHNGSNPNHVPGQPIIFYELPPDKPAPGPQTKYVDGPATTASAANDMVKA